MPGSRTQRGDADEARTHGPSVSSQVLYSTTEPLRSMQFRPTLAYLHVYNIAKKMPSFEVLNLKLPDCSTHSRA